MGDGEGGVEKKDVSHSVKQHATPFNFVVFTTMKKVFQLTEDPQIKKTRERERVKQQQGFLYVVLRLPT